MKAEQSLADATKAWTTAAIVREYADDAAGRAAFAQEVEVLSLHGYAPSSQSSDGGHVHVGRLLATSGWSVLAGKRGIRSDGRLSVTFQKTSVQHSPAQRPTPTKVCPDCAETVQAAALICRFCRHEFPLDPPATFGYWTVVAKTVDGLGFGDTVALAIDGDRLVVWRPGGDRIGAGWERGSVRVVVTQPGRVYVYYMGTQFLFSLLPSGGDTGLLAEAFPS